MASARHQVFVLAMLVTRTEIAGSSNAQKAAADTDVAFEESACAKSVTEGRRARKR